MTATSSRTRRAFACPLRLFAVLAIAAAILFDVSHARADESLALFFAQDHGASATPKLSSRYERRPVAPEPRIGAPLGLHPLADIARHYVGSGRFTRYARAWCRDALNVWLRQGGFYTDGDGRARAVAKIVRPIGRPVVGAVAWRAHHAGVVTAVNGDRVTLVSGNYGNRVAVETTSAGRYRYGLPMRVASR